MELADIVHTLPKTALLGDSLKSRIQNIGRIAKHKCRRIKPGNKCAPIETVAAIHYVPDFISNIKRLIHHSRGHHTDKICFNLKVKVIRMRIVQPVSGHRRHHSLTDIIASCLVCVGEVIIGIGKLHRKFGSRAVQPVLIECLGKSEVIVDVVKQARLAVPPIFHISLTPRNRLRVGDERSLVLELSRSAIDDTDGLACPTTFNSVLKFFFGHCHQSCHFRFVRLVNFNFRHGYER